MMRTISHESSARSILARGLLGAAFLMLLAPGASAPAAAQPPQAQPPQTQAPQAQPLQSALPAGLRTLEGDYVMPNFRFASGEALPELRLHFTTLGKARRDEHGRVTNAVLILHLSLIHI